MNRRWWYLLLLLPFPGTLLPGLYNRIDPTLFGLPFFYWYQLAWIPVTTILLTVVIIATKDRHV